MKNNYISIKYLKKPDVYLIIDKNNKVIHQFYLNFIKYKFFSRTLCKYSFLFRHLIFFGLLPNINYKEFL